MAMRERLGGTSRRVSHPDWRAIFDRPIRSSSSGDDACRFSPASRSQTCNSARRPPDQDPLPRNPTPEAWRARRYGARRVKTCPERRGSADSNRRAGRKRLLRLLHNRPNGADDHSAALDLQLAIGERPGNDPSRGGEGQDVADGQVAFRGSADVGNLDTGLAAEDGARNHRQHAAAVEVGLNDPPTTGSRSRHPIRPLIGMLHGTVRLSIGAYIRCLSTPKLVILRGPAVFIFGCRTTRGEPAGLWTGSARQKNPPMTGTPIRA